jgi:xylan 1,4-beta-xylosidase
MESQLRQKMKRLFCAQSNRRVSRRILLGRPGLVMLALVEVCLAQAPQIGASVDVSIDRGELRPVWSWFGYDEPNYTYMKDGQKLLSQLAGLSRVPVYVRAHNLLTSGDGTPALKWGSTNAYTEDAASRPVYDWTITDRIFDTYVSRGMKPLVEIGFMPEALTTGPPPYRHAFSVEKPYGSIFTGWAYPPKDYKKWAELVYRWVRHCVSRYGRSEVESWLWEVWNEPNIGYWRGTPEEYNKLYDYAADAVKRALPAARIGGPHSTGPGSEKAREFLRSFLEHCVRGKNHATGAVGSPLDFVAFHAKGRPAVVDGHVRMGINAQLTDIEKGFETIASYPELKGKPIVIGESDPEGCAACSSRVHKQNGYRNGTMYSSYTAASFARKYDLAEKHGVNFLGAVTWAFEFEDQPWFDGFRDLATNGVEKPVLNVFRMFGLMGQRRVQASSDGMAALDEIVREGVRGKPDVGVLASRSERRATVMLWHYHDDDVAGPDMEVRLEVKGLGDAAGRVRVVEYRVDRSHSNSYEAWKRMGSPEKVTAEQYAQLEGAAALGTAGSPEWVTVRTGSTTRHVRLGRQGVALLEFTW